ncbi:TPA: chorismate synthase [Staphylococcus aureus]|uniref:chorismate synthase n=5 Tax=Staphylococcus aureus TaxID=1280 RepID=UPI0001DD9BB0|nr:chorismate synthase [Staphylococcus aureus]HDJ6916345.1 chorismate synthase [Staphylococcus aureus Sa_TPS3169]HDJ6919150.1 chorismate synthase [Staphylococcus aureus Sa_TPS3162]HDJ6927472.1 chorismate synthase [Staphylococcus aureus Sa_TPS3157]HDJ6930059.1 chorismate synthase [Staphylococcus aureus Sa_TPS3148]HDJ6935584.1 chorismate synthase [Staphylococcus aureus Sa_TPS3161]HDJ6941001.1 chorismate synthase [Staphylococcus aureus Sa_TPS3174]HDJ6946628.1 chorismate synthase [Staphylococcus
MRYLTSGESHGPQLTVIVEGIPANLEIKVEDINKEMFKRQGGYGRGRRMQIEKDTVEIVSGVRNGYTLGSPITMVVTNDDFTHWRKIMGAAPISEEERENMKRTITKPRPGHADLVGGMKYNHRDLRNVLERSSARETAARVAVGALCKVLLQQLDIDIYSRVVEIGGIKDRDFYDSETFKANLDRNDVRVIDDSIAQAMRDKIDEAKNEGDSIGGVVQVVVENMPVGVGSYVHYDRKLDGKIAQGVVSINAFKGVSFGEGFKAAEKPGSEIQDEILYNSEIGYYRGSNHLGGLEGGMSNGMPIIVNGVMKPIPTLYKPLNSVDINTKEDFKATIERSDSCAVPAASIVCEHVVAFEIAKALLEEFQSNHIEQLKQQIIERRQLNIEF